MAMEVVRSALVAALLFITPVVLSANASASADDAAAAAVEELGPTGDEEPYMLVAFHNKDGEEMRLLADKGTETLSASGFANRSGHWFYAIREGEGKRRVPKPTNTPSRFWNTLGALANTTAAVASGDPAADDDEQGYVLVGMETSGGHMIRLVVVADQRYFFITGFAQGFFRPRIWSFRDGERHRLLTTLGGNGGSHAEVVASNVLALKEAYYDS